MEKSGKKKVAQPIHRSEISNQIAGDLGKAQDLENQIENMSNPTTK